MSLASLVRTAMNAVPTEMKARIVFTETKQVFDSATGLTTPASATVAGTASQDEGNLDERRLRYQRLSLREESAVTLIFVPDTAGQKPALGAACSWGGESYTVRDVEPIAPAGSAVAASVVIAR